MITVNSISGGKTSAYIAANYKADYNVFSLVRTNDKRVMFPDEKLRQYVSDKINDEFIGTLEEDTIIYTIIELEQYIGQEIQWVSGKTFDEVINRNGKKYLPNVTQRFCTSEMKLNPLYNWWKENFTEPIEMRIGYRANEGRRALKAKDKQSKNGFQTYKDIVGHSLNGRNKWAEIEWQKQIYPLINDGIFKDQIDEYWKDKPVRFAYMNNCVGCFHRNEILLNYMSKLNPKQYDWFIRAEQEAGCNIRTFKNGITYEKIKQYQFQQMFDFDDFNDCDSGYCGL